MRYAVITGATQGIGKAVAEKFLSEGFNIAVCSRSKDDLTAVESEWNNKYPAGSIAKYPADLSIKEDVVAFSTYVLANFPHVDVLVNNAGAFFPGKLGEEPDGQLEKLMATNLYSAYHLTRCFLPGMKERRSGHIFNMCSVASLKAYDNGGAYSISKYALLGFSDNLRHELMPDRIKVTAVCPGATYSRSWASSGIDPERIMESADIATMIWSAYELSPRANVDNIVLRPLQGDL
ncbi:MAG: SDR family oxidoreductase [Sphingobacteriales bacterium]|nr:MAG: SDR family oxidoreductase [Sphingobacteriales bacterium]